MIMEAQLFSVKLLSIELFLLLFMVCIVNNICSGVAVVGGSTGQSVVGVAGIIGQNGPAGEISAVTSGKPYFDDISARNVTAAVDEPVILKCRIKNKGDRTVSWMRKRDLHILTSNIYTYTGDQRFSIIHPPDSDDYDLKIEYAQQRDSGIYECQVNTEPKINLAVHLEVTAARAKILGSLEVYVKRGSTISLACAVNIHASSIVWYHGQQVVDFDSVRGGISLETEKTDSGTTSRLLLTRAQLRDSGNYTCVPTGAVSASVQVHVLNGEHPAAMQTSSGVPCPSHTALLVLCLLTLYNSNHHLYYYNSLFQTISHIITFPITSTGRTFSR